MPCMHLVGKTALVTGGARRVGRAIVEELASGGCRVAVHYHRSADEAAALLNAGSNLVLVQGDLRQPDAARALVAATVEQLGAIDILVNSAADYARTPLDTLDDAVFTRMHELNVA